MINFKKYQSIDNYYLANIELWKEKYLDIEEEKFVILEKIDGANIQFIFEPNIPYRIGRRTNLLKENEKFYNIWEFIHDEKIDIFINYIQSICNTSGNNYRIYLEYYGPKINNRVWYGSEKDIVILDCEINNVLMSHEQLIDRFNRLKCENLTPPIISYEIGLTNALNACCDFESKVPCDATIDNPAEGIIIKPFTTNFYDYRGNRLIYKKKNEKFSEIRPKKSTRIKINSEEIDSKFLEYINYNRMISIFTNFGKITNKSEIGKYINLISSDAIEDFKKDNLDLDFNEKVLIKIASKEICKLLLMALNKENENVI